MSSYAIRVGTVMMKSGTELPVSAQLEGDTYTPGWRMLRNLDGKSIDTRVRNAGWTFFFMEPNIQAIAWGSHDTSTIQKAVKGILAKVKRSKFNCLEITEIAAKKFLGFPYVSVSGHSRHIKNSITM